VGSFNAARNASLPQSTLERYAECLKKMVDEVVNTKKGSKSSLSYKSKVCFGLVRSYLGRLFRIILRRYWLFAFQLAKHNGIERFFFFARKSKQQKKKKSGRKILKPKS
jgi:hypothetical protein